MDYNKLKRAGEIHKEVEKFLRNEVLVVEKDEVLKLYDIAEKIEHKIEELNGNIAFPTGLNINDCAAHFTPNPTDKNLVLGKNDLIKIDYGVHIGGNIVDGAFSFSFSNKFDNLINASKDATQEAIKMSGPDSLLSDIGENTEEIIESYGYKSIRDLCGHQIGLYRIHSGKVVPNIRFPQYTERMNAGEEYAIETFPTTGDGGLYDKTEHCSHYMVNYAHTNYKKKGKGFELFNKIMKNYGTLAFCKRWLIGDGCENGSKIWSERVNTDLERLCKRGAIVAYPPRYDISGSYVSQTEKSIYIMENGCIELN